MKDILTAPFIDIMKKATKNMYRLGWDERNGGNISYMLEEEQVKEYLDITNVIREIPTGFDAKALIGKIFIVTGTGKYLAWMASANNFTSLVLPVPEVPARMTNGFDLKPR